MRIYEGGPRQEYEEVLRAMGTFLDQRGMREILISETSDGFVVQGLAPMTPEGRSWSDAAIALRKETLIFLEDDVARFIEEAYALRRRGRPPAALVPDRYYENALRVLGRYFDQQKPRDIFLFEHERSFVVRLLMAARTGDRHILAEFTRDEMEQMISGATELRSQRADARPSADARATPDGVRRATLPRPTASARPAATLPTPPPPPPRAR